MSKLNIISGWFLLMSFLALLSISLRAQSQWQPIQGQVSNKVYCFYTDTIDSVLYVGGMFKYINGIELNGIGYWDGSAWNDMDKGQQDCTLACSVILSITKYNGQIVAGGEFDSIGTISANSIASWDGSFWHPLADGLKDSVFINGMVYDMVVHNNELYVAGNFDSAGSIRSPNITKWDGSKWDSVGFPIPVHAIESYNGSIYSGTKGLWRYNGLVWEEVKDSNSVGIGGNVYALTVYQDMLVAGGWFHTSGGSPGNDIAGWDGNNWSDFNQGIAAGCSFFEIPINDLMVKGSTLYAGGNFSCIGSQTANWVARWNGNSWCGSQSTFEVTWPDLLSEGIYTLAEYKGGLVIGGLFHTIDGGEPGGLAILPDRNDLCKPVGISESMRPMETIQVYPNPASSLLSITLPLSHKANSSKRLITVFDILGNELLNQRISSQIEVYTLPVASFKSGTYFLKVSSYNRHSSVVKFSVIH